VVMALPKFTRKPAAGTAGRRQSPGHAAQTLRQPGIQAPSRTS